MNILEKLKRWWSSLFNRNDAAAVFNVTPIYSDKMNSALVTWRSLEKGTPIWVDESVRSICFSNTVARELASLIALETDIKITGGNSELLQNAIDECFLRKENDVIEKMLRLGGVMAKWNGEDIEYIVPERFIPTETNAGGDITGCVFLSFYTSNNKYYTRAEWHRFEGEHYRISNRAYVSDSENDMGRECSLKNTQWADIQPETQIDGLTQPLFAYLKCPYSNTVDENSPLGVSIFSECIEELRWLDIAMSTLGTEIEDSRPILFIDAQQLKFAKKAEITLPRFVQALGNPDTEKGNTIEQWSPTLQIESRKEGINFMLSIISYKCGFDPGYFVFNGQNIKVATATQVEATERRTVNTVLSYRAILDRPTGNGDSRTGFIHDIAYIIDAMQVAGGQKAYSEYGNYEIYADFKDLTVNEEEEKAFDYQLSNSGFMAKWRFLVRHLGLTEEQAKQMVLEAQEESKATSGGGLFEEE